MGIVNNIEIGDKAQNPLLFRHLDLFNGNLIRGTNHGNRGHLQRLELGILEEFELTGAEGDSGRGPGRKALRLYLYRIGNSRFETMESKRSVLVGLDCASIPVIRALECRGRAGNEIAVCIRDRTADVSGTCSIRALSRCRTRCRRNG